MCVGACVCAFVCLLWPQALVATMTQPQRLVDSSRSSTSNFFSSLVNWRSDVRPTTIIITTTFVLAALSYLASPSQPLPMESKRRFVLFRFSRPRAKPAQPCPYRLLVITPSRHSGLCLFLSPRAICADISAVTNLKTLLTVRLDSHRSRCPRTHLTTAVRRAGYW